MKPKTKLQHQICNLRASVPDLSREQVEWALAQHFAYYAYKTKRKMICFECGKEIPLVEAADRFDCPSCGKHLRVLDNHKKNIKQMYYLCMVSVVGEFQVLRFFFVQHICKLGEKAYGNITEVVQNWIDQEGRVTTVAKLTNPFATSYTGYWQWSSDLEIRHDYNDYRHNINPHLFFPKKEVLPKLKRNGFKNGFHNITPTDLFTSLLKDSTAETLFKAGQYRMLQYYIYRVAASGSTFHWPSVKICIRNGYKITDPEMWNDYIDLLIYFRKDIRNAKYVCPEYLKERHDRLVNRQKAIFKKQKEEERRREIAEADRLYKKSKGKYFNIALSDGNLQVVILKSVNEFLEEGEIMDHCVFSNEYYKKDDSLILSARKGIERLETIEVSLSKKKVIQCRGAHNKNTEYHDSIVDLVNNNIKKFLTAPRTRKLHEYDQKVAV